MLAGRLDIGATRALNPANREGTGNPCPERGEEVTGMVITITKVEEIEATRIHLTPNEAA